MSCTVSLAAISAFSICGYILSYFYRQCWQPLHTVPNCLHELWLGTISLLSSDGKHLLTHLFVEGVRSLPALQPVPACLIRRVNSPWYTSRGHIREMCADQTVWIVVHSSQHSHPLEKGVGFAESSQTTPKNLTEKPGKQSHSIHSIKTERMQRLLNTTNYKPISQSERVSYEKTSKCKSFAGMELVSDNLIFPLYR